MSENLLPYIGVSGVVSVADHHAVATAYESAGFTQTTRGLVLGVKATTNTQVLDRENKYGPAWYPVADDLTSAIDPREVVGAGVVQLYSGDWEQWDGSARPLINQAVGRAQDWIEGAQFDQLPFMNAPEASQRVLAYAGALIGQRRVILQCPEPIMSAYEPYQVAEKLRQLHGDGSIDFVLFDASGGQGVELSPDRLSSWLGATRHLAPDLAVGVAGGLNAERVARLLPVLIERFGPNISWDAEARLHNPRPDQGGDGALNMTAVAEYLQASAAVLQSVK